MAAESPHNRRRQGAAPLPVSALPVPDAPAKTPDEPQEPALPTGSSGELSPAQRARLGLDSFGAQPAAPAGQPPAAPSGPEPALAPVQELPRLAPVGPAGRVPDAETAAGRARQQAAAQEPATPQRRREEELSVSERDGIAQMERDRSVFGYGVAWTFFCIVVAAVISIANVTSNPDMGPSPGAFAPAMISIVIGWVVVAVGHSMKAWGWLMIVPAVVLILGPFVYTNWRIEQIRGEARGFLSKAGSAAAIDIDSSSILSSTVNTGQGCFALYKQRAGGDTRIDVVTYLPTTAQQQATFALAPRFARRVAPGGTRVTQRSFTMVGGRLPVVPVELATAPIDCASSTGG